jgi:hypothetical protein
MSAVSSVLVPSLETMGGKLGNGGSEDVSKLDVDEAELNEEAPSSGGKEGGRVGIVFVPDGADADALGSGGGAELKPATGLLLN